MSGKRGFESVFKVSLKTNRDVLLDKDTPYFTIFDPKNVYRTDPEEIRTLVVAAGKTFPEEVVSYRPERRALHSLAARLNFCMRTASDKEYSDLVEKIYRDYVLPNGGEVFARIEAKRKEIENHFSQNFDTDTPAYKIAVDREYGKSQEIQDWLKVYVEGQIDLALQAGVFTPLPPPNAHYKNIMILGAPGTGKSTLSKRFSAYFEGDCAIITGDNYRRLLIEDVERAVEVRTAITRLSGREAKRIYDVAEQVFGEISQHPQKAPATVWEISDIHDSNIQPILKTGKDTPVYCYFIDTPVKTALERALSRATTHFERINDKDRYLEPDIVLNMHREMALKFGEFLVNNYNKKFLFEMGSNDVEKGDPPTIIAFGRSSGVWNGTNEFNIVDIDRLVEFLKKRFLNPEAQSYEELYQFPDLQGMHPDQLIKNSLRNIAGSYTMNFVDNDGNIYATLNRGVIEIADVNVFEERAGKNAVIKLFETKKTETGLSALKTRHTQETYIKPNTP